MPEQPSISKRAARRLIQRAIVLTGRNRSVRQHIREVHLATLWVLEDWNLEWTVNLDRGRVHFDRRPTRKPDVTLTWPNAEEFFSRIQEGGAPDDTLAMEGDPELRTYVDPVYRSFCRSLEEVIKYPFDDAENPRM
ncbi:MAG: hypothetical protein P8Z30_15440 [Acidobacteriota bacterium]